MTVLESANFQAHSLGILDFPSDHSSYLESRNLNYNNDGEGNGVKINDVSLSFLKGLNSFSDRPFLPSPPFQNDVRHKMRRKIVSTAAYKPAFDLSRVLKHDFSSQAKKRILRHVRSNGVCGGKGGVKRRRM
uniref:Uncharacterized protein n=1 Tax=Polytomella parva TaxID=51329 RepID=A0A7S0VJT2_9CHLO|mmetsp:Transcript_765/g.1007  ORF Transcript_765/g.1007 Transcript_765/m.1007 type:complete len:132 (+) Transcript_765:477-872(+)